jgi:tetratricopeptide (TPR) repeat protein
LKDKSQKEILENFEALVQLYFIKNNYARVNFYAEQIGLKKLLNEILIKSSFGNEHAWTCYRIGDSYYQSGKIQNALPYLIKANELAKFQPDFKEKLATIYSDLGQADKAIQLYESVLKEDPRHVTTMANYGFLKLQLGRDREAEDLYAKGISLDPDHEGLLLNMAGLMNYRRNYKEARKWIEKILKRNPNHAQAKAILEQLKSLN